MSTPQLTTRSLRAARLQARIPRILAALLVCVLCLAGLRVILAGPQRPAPARTIVNSSGDLAATSFAQAFARAYLSFDPSNPDARERALAPFVGTALDADAGVQPGNDAAQRVEWTAALGDRQDGDRRLVTVMAQTSAGLIYLSVPVARDARGFLSIAGYPALVGPPAIDRQEAQTSEDDVEDQGLQTVVTRALGNYLAANQRNLMADLTPDAVVSLPSQRLQIERVDGVTWVTAGRRVAVQVDAQDGHGTTWTLRYELDVLKRDRWYVRSLQVDPTFQGGS